jgi:hypothetical protein
MVLLAAASDAILAEIGDEGLIGIHAVLSSDSPPYHHQCILEPTMTIINKLLGPETSRAKAVNFIEKSGFFGYIEGVAKLIDTPRQTKTAKRPGQSNPKPPEPQDSKLIRELLADMKARLCAIQRPKSPEGSSTGV